METLHEKGFFPYDEYDCVIFLTLIQSIGAEQADSSQTAEELRYPLVIAHNIAIRMREQDI
jgi:hypothetical protein